jgi:polyphenol oxidase
MLRKEKENIVWMEFELLQDIPQLIHAVFLRHGGVSRGAFSSLNVGLSVGDDPQCVFHNREKIRILGGYERLAVVKQEHTDRLVVISPSSDEEVPVADGMLTREQATGLMISHADCQAAIFVDPVQKVIANVHAGWRGMVQNIYGKTVQALQDVWGCRPDHLLVCISPSLGPDIAEFQNFEREFPPSFWPYQIRPTYFDLWAIAKWQLIESGVLEEHIQIAEICTYSHAEDFFSYRRHRICGRNATVVGWAR